MLAEQQFGTQVSFMIDRDWLGDYARQVILLRHPSFNRATPQ